MRIININKLTKLRKSNKPLIIGYFSCIHVMHNELLRHYNEFNILTFKDTKYKSNDQIYGYKDRLANLSNFNVNNCYVYDIDKANITAERFVHLFLKKINPSVILVGSDFKFGSDQKGVSELKKNFNVVAVSYHEEVSTKMIAKLLKNNEIESANDYLLFPYYYKGRWISGRKKGRVLGFRTVNIKVNEPLFVNEGTYAVRLTIGRKTYNGVAFYGASKTFGLSKQSVEVHVIDKKILSKAFYPLPMRLNLKVEFLKFIRQNKKFYDFDELKRQIEKDISVADKFFKNN